MSNNKKRKVDQVDSDDKHSTGPSKQKKPMEYFYDTGRSSGGKLSHQVKYGPNLGFDTGQQKALETHFGTKDVLSRYTQYDSKRMTYVKSSEGMGRGLTEQESLVKKNRDPGPTSINHIIASGTGQHALNRSTLEFLGAEKSLKQEFKKSLDKRDPKVLAKGLGEQAAAIGRMRGFGREILREESRSEGYGRSFDTSKLSEKQGFVEKRNLMSQDVLGAMQGGSLDSYKRYLKNSFDSVGNLRLGHASGNTRVSTGFDMPLDSNSEPTQRGQRLLLTYQSFGFQDMSKDQNVGKRNKVGVFTVNHSGLKLSSSQQVDNDTVNHSKRFD